MAPPSSLMALGNDNSLGDHRSPKEANHSENNHLHNSHYSNSQGNVSILNNHVQGGVKAQGITPTLAETNPVYYRDEPQNVNYKATANSITETAMAIDLDQDDNAENKTIIRLPNFFYDCSMEHLLTLITFMLEQLVDHNDKLPLAPSQLTRFHSR